MQKSTQNVHFIAIGGSAMHSLAVALKEKGYQVSGSDDEIFEPSLSNLKNAGILPETMGWHPERITPELDAVILGMHAKADNPELIKAKELGLKIFSYPQYVYEQSKNKHRVVIAGSHGKTTVTAITLHVLRHIGKEADYMVGAAVPGIANQIKLSDAPLIIIEGDEYPASPLHKNPKFSDYHHHIAVINGIAWDHMNVYPVYADYVKQFENLADSTPRAGALIYNDDDKAVRKICKKERVDVTPLPYSTLKSKTKDGITYLKADTGDIPLQIFGKHNLTNLAAAKTLLNRLRVTDEEFYDAIKSFRGASRRMQLLASSPSCNVYSDFAHSPSKVDAAVNAVKAQFPKRKLVACLELHTFSSLNKDFIPEYKNTLTPADEAIVYYSPETVKHKGLAPLSEEYIRKEFNNKKIKVITDSETLQRHLTQLNKEPQNFLFMSSGNWGGTHLQSLADTLCK